MRIAQDAIPGSIIPMWFKTDQGRHIRSDLAGNFVVSDIIV